MLRNLLLTLALLAVSHALLANYYSFLPYTIKQPDGSKIDCYVSGDEFFNWIHDADGFTIIQADDGYYYYGKEDGDVVKPTKYRVNQVNPGLVGLKKWARISGKVYEKTRMDYYAAYTKSAKSPVTDTTNNLVIYIKFSDDSEFSSTRQYFDDKFNPETGVSLKSYFREVSYNLLTISSTHYPACPMTVNLSYTDTHPRSYFEPYNATTNPGGYSNESERTIREHTLLKDAIDWINVNSPVPSGLNIDGDNDGNIDNICFNVRGNNGAWAALLWAHSWVLYSYNVTINGKHVWEYTFQPETQLDVKTLCHEMFHSIGAPDLYHYSYDGLHPVQNWDLMEYGFGHMGAYMKWKYSDHAWIASIPEITASGTYTLNPLSASSNNCYKIASPNSPTEYFVLEYRKASGTFEGTLPGSGLLVYRIDPSWNGNANGPPDEVYIYRINGTTTANGSPNSAFLSAGSGRTAINDATNPSSFLQSGSPGGLNIYNVTSAGTTISFTVGINTIGTPTQLATTVISSSRIDLTWHRNSSNYNCMLVSNTSPVFGNPVGGTSYAPGNTIPGGGTVVYVGSSEEFSHTGLTGSTTYYYKLYSVSPDNYYSYGISQQATTSCASVTLPYAQSFQSEVLPSCWSVQSSATGSNYTWSLVQSVNAGGSPFEIRSNHQSVSQGFSRLISAPINTTGMVELSLTFKHMLDALSTGATLRIQTSTDLVNWVNEDWSMSTSSQNIGPAMVSVPVLHNLDSPVTYIAFTVEGDLNQFDYWYIDDVTISEVPGRLLNLNLFLEGLFNGTGMNKAHNAAGNQYAGSIADQITFELHNPLPPYERVGTTYCASLNTDGTSSTMIPSALSGEYYIVIKHRNSIEIWSAMPVIFSGSTVTYDFRTIAGQSYGGNQKLISGSYVIPGGDCNQDGIIDSGDLIQVDNAAYSFLTGYIPDDINGDGLVDSSDMIIVDNNSMLFVGKVTP